MSITAECALTTGAGRAIGHAMAVRLAPDDVASFVFFVAGPDPDYMTGQSGLIARAWCTGDCGATLCNSGDP